jgi:hypothetical protein
MSDKKTKEDDTIPQPTEAEAAPPADADEAEAVERYEDAKESGLSDAEAREEGWPSEPEEDDEVAELKRGHAIELERVMGGKLKPAMAANASQFMDNFVDFAVKAEDARGSVPGRKRLRVLAIHGVNTGDEDPVGELWEDMLNASGIRCKVEELRWGSTGLISGDVAAFTSIAYRNKVNQIVEDGIAKFAADGPGIIICHSMGTVLAIHAMRKLRLDMPIICLASPLSNRALLGSMRAVGYGGTAYGKPKHYWNDDDPIPGGSASLQPSYFDAVRIAVPDPEVRKMNANSEHDVRLYLRHPLVLDGIMEAAKSLVS